NQHQVQNLEPRSERIIRVLEDRADIEREPIRGFAAFVTRPMPRALCASRIYLVIAASRASHAVRPTLMNEVILASRLVRKHPVEVSKAQLFYDFGFVFPFGVHPVHIQTVPPMVICVKSGIVA